MLCLQQRLLKSVVVMVLLVVASGSRPAAARSGEVRPGALLVSDVAEIAATPAVKRAGVSGGRVTSNTVVTQPESLLVMIGHFDGTVAPCTTATAQRVLYSDPAHLDVRDYYLTASHGGISQFNATVMDDVAVPLGRCYENDWADYLDDQARAHGVDPDKFTRNMYVLPNSGCGGGAAGEAEIGGKRSFVRVCSLATMGHELGHSFGMDHANALGVPYGDIYDIMTQGVNDASTREINAVHRLQLNWIPTERVVDVTTSGTYTLGALERDGLSIPQILRISPKNGTPVYVSYRETFGTYDATIQPAAATYVYRWDGGPTDLRQVLSDGNIFEESGIVSVKQVSHVTGAATVQVTLEASVSPPPPPPSPTCPASATTLCLQDGRFSVTATWNSGTGHGSATAVPFSTDAGLFWFFDATNAELAVKVLAATNSNYWVYFGGMTNLEYTITVKDTVNGVTKTYHNPSGGTCGGRDTDFYNPNAIASSGGSQDTATGVIAQTTPPTDLTCNPDADTLCLQPGGDTIKVQASWRTSDGVTGTGLGGLLPGSSKSGDFIFFDARNVELLAKVLDARTVNARYWIYTGALSDVEYWITFTDTTSRRWVTIHNPQGSYCGAANTSSLY